MTPTDGNSTSRGARPFGRLERMVAWRYMGATRSGSGVSLISIIAFAGIMLSVATLIVVLSVFQGFRITLLDQLLSVNGHAFVATAPPFDDYQERADRLAALDNVERVTPVLNIQAMGFYEEASGLSYIQGITKEDLLAIEEVSGDQALRQGSFDSFSEGRNGGKDIAIGVGLARTLGVRAGDVVTLVTAGGAETPFGAVPTTEASYRVGAIFSIGNFALDSVYVYMPLEQAQIFARKRGEVTRIEVRVDDPLNIEAAIPTLQTSAGPDAILSNWQDENRDFFNALQVERGLQRIILLMIVAVATLNIISGLVMLVKDKRSDIAVLRTMGARQDTVLRVFLLVGATLGVAGAAAGVALGALIASNLGAIESFLSWAFNFRFFPPSVYYLDEIPSILVWEEVVIVIIFTLGMSFISAAYPAWRASRIDPVEALRYE